MFQAVRASLARRFVRVIGTDGKLILLAFHRYQYLEQIGGPDGSLMCPEAWSFLSMQRLRMARGRRLVCSDSFLLSLKQLGCRSRS